MVVVIWGVAGVGKTTIGQLLARELGWKFSEADDFHPQANIDKMRSGIPLTDEDRQPWLEELRDAIKQALAANEDMILACSVLKKKYRDRLKVSDQVRFVFLRGDRKRIRKQLRQRRGHFMNPNLLESQFTDLEEPMPAEDVLALEVGGEPRELVKQIKSSLRQRAR